MSCRLRLCSGASCLVIAFAMGVLCVPGRAAADQDDHSYLPPWMLAPTGTVRKANDKAAQSAMARARAARPVKANAQPAEAEAEAEVAKTNGPDAEASGLTARAMQMKTKAVGFVSGILQRSFSFAGGE
jgi:hypothetical protein